MKNPVRSLALIVVLLLVALPIAAECPFVFNIDDPPCIEHLAIYGTVLEYEPDWCVYAYDDVVLVNHDAYGNVLWYYVYPSSGHGDTFYFHHVLPYATLMDVSGCGLIPSTADVGD